MWINFSFRKAFWLFFFVFSLIKRDIWTILHKQTHFLVTQSNSPMWREIKLHRNFLNLCFQVSFSQNFQLAASLFYSIIRNFSYFRPKGCCCFYPVSCVFLLHMGLLITTYANLVNVWKTSGEAGDQRVKKIVRKPHLLTPQNSSLTPWLWTLSGTLSLYCKRPHLRVWQKCQRASVFETFNTDFWAILLPILGLTKPLLDHRSVTCNNWTVLSAYISTVHWIGLALLEC